MLLGQLYYYDSLLEKFHFPLTHENVNQLELLGVERITQGSAREISSQEIRLELRDVFSKNFLKTLRENGLAATAKLWEEATSPLSNTEDRNITELSTFQQKVSEWISGDMSFEAIPDLLALGKLSTEESDVALFYGIKVLYLLSQQTDTGAATKVHIPILDPTSAQLSDSPQILICSHPEFFPLFKNLNCAYTGYLNDPDAMSEAIKESLQHNPSVSLILLADPEAEEHIDFVRKHIPSGVLVSSLNLQTETLDGPTFFDTIVRNTLGIRLTDNQES